MIDLTKDKSPMVSDSVARLLKVNKEELRKMTITTQTRYVCVAGGLYLESLDIMPKRVEMWDWMVACLARKKDPFLIL